MANFYLDNPSLKHHLYHPLMKRIVELKERNFTDKDQFDYAPINFEDAMDSYEKVMEIAGDVIGNVVAPNAEDVDRLGGKLKNKRVQYAPGTIQNLQAITQAGLMGLSMPRIFGGLNFPMVTFIMASDIAARADAGFCNLWALQDCIITLYEFGNEQQHKQFIPRVCAGETLSMDLTEPDAGSDLQAVALKATYDEKKDCWRLNGVKRFITNGDADIHLVLARSEEGTKDGRGLSMFIYDKKDGGVDVRRIENKMGIKGSPTCELTYKNAKAQLCGKRKYGLIKYVMSLMNGARLGIMAQATGLSEAAYREAIVYARERKQFGKTIIEFPAVYEMISNIKAKLYASRSILYETARFVDIYKILEEIAKERPLNDAEKLELKKYKRLSDAFTPLGKAMNTEYANQNTYDCIQIHGGSGFMKDYTCERLYRDARITSIYEGTTQLQVVAAIRHVLTDTYLTQIEEYQAIQLKPELNNLKQRLSKSVEIYKQLVKKVASTKNAELIDFHARRLVECAGHLILSYLLLLDANRNPAEFAHSAEVYANYGEAEIKKIQNFINRFNIENINFYKQL
ncbi:MAG: Acyl-CoA dehydrogenase C-terminal domain-containing protein [Candidatus Azobacteroides pseudotrichonymphae]|jgi:alkylation response protein AidB-like acyl-CoA dehydrogenase|nr:MAG: Acyl-CoA dehydrogenase C-terminal domain-containing protein [Candidatus Azobacteroides pseudotrichonymphae]